MKYFITGGAGFIGREVVNQLLNSDNEVCIYDNFSFGTKHNIEDFLSSKNFEVIEGDLSNKDLLYRSMMNFNPTIVIHLAAIHFIPYCNTHPNETLEVNTTGTYNVLEAADKLGIERLIFASSGAIYASTEQKLIESNETPAPVDIYGISKLLGEEICEYFSRISKIQIVAARLFNTYGPYETNEHILPVIIEQLKANPKKIQLGNIKPKRDYINVQDTARGLIEFSKCQLDNNYEVVNLGTGSQYSVEELVLKIEKLCSHPIKIEIDQNRVRNVDKMYQLASISRLETLTAWKPTINLDEGLQKLLHFEGFI